jgi:hypothetical protein
MTSLNSLNVLSRGLRLLVPHISNPIKQSRIPQSYRLSTLPSDTAFLSIPPLETFHRCISTTSLLKRDFFDQKALVSDKARTIDFGTDGELNLTQIQELPILEERLLEKAREEEGARVQIKIPERLRPLDWMPTPDDYESLYDGIKYRDLPIIYIQAIKNNTKLTMTGTQHSMKAAYYYLS